MFGGGGFAEALDPDVMYLWAQADKARPVACEIHRTILALWTADKRAAPTKGSGVQRKCVSSQKEKEEKALTP